MAQTRKTAAMTAGKQNTMRRSTSVTAKTKTTGKTRGRTKLRVKSGALKRVALIVLVFVIAIGFMNQYSRIISVGAEINAMEKEIKNTQMLTDSLEAQVIKMINWDQIEYIAKTRLNMVEPTKECYTSMELKQLPQAYTQEKAAAAESNNAQAGTVTEKLSSIFVWLTN